MITKHDLHSAWQSATGSSIMLSEEETFAGLACQAVIILDGCMRIEGNAFTKCVGLVYVRIPAETEVAQNVFSGCLDVVIDRTAD